MLPLLLLVPLLIEVGCDDPRTLRARSDIPYMAPLGATAPQGKTLVIEGDTIRMEDEEAATDEELVAAQDDEHQPVTDIEIRPYCMDQSNPPQKLPMSAHNITFTMEPDPPITGRETLMSATATTVTTITSGTWTAKISINDDVS